MVEINILSKYGLSYRSDRPQFKAQSQERDAQRHHR